MKLNNLKIAPYTLSILSLQVLVLLVVTAPAGASESIETYLGEEAFHLKEYSRQGSTIAVDHKAGDGSTASVRLICDGRSSAGGWKIQSLRGYCGDGMKAGKSHVSMTPYSKCTGAEMDPPPGKDYCVWESLGDITGDTGDDMFKIYPGKGAYLEYTKVGGLGVPGRISYIERTGGEDKPVMIPAGPKDDYTDFLRFLHHSPGDVVKAELACSPIRVSLCKGGTPPEIEISSFGTDAGKPVKRNPATGLLQTKDRTLVIKGRTNTGADIVRLYLDDKRIGEFEPDDSGKWIFDHTDTVIDKGLHTFTAEGVKSVGASYSPSGSCSGGLCKTATSTRTILIGDGLCSPDPGDIRKGVTICGVTGTLKPKKPKLETVTIPGRARNRVSGVWKGICYAPNSLAKISADKRCRESGYHYAIEWQRGPNTGSCATWTGDMWHMSTGGPTIKRITCKK